MPTTKYKIIEQCLERINGHPSSTPARVTEGQVAQKVADVWHSLLKTEIFTVHMPNGDTIPPGSVLATYEGNEVEEYGDRSRMRFPAVPIMLPRNMGYFSITDPECPDDQYIPVPAGQTKQIKTQKLLNVLVGKKIYELKADVKSPFAEFATNLAPRKLDVQLVVMDMSMYSDHDILPLTPDHAHQIVSEVVNFFGNAPFPDKKVDSGSVNQQPKQ